ncbi:MAG TPA: iduronate-2-sulfatase [Verrucomicrobiales bacterium]|nr:iduronate-2-sulfatase [Verrucomicrobiales bacterium]
MKTPLACLPSLVRRSICVGGCLLYLPSATATPADDGAPTKSGGGVQASIKSNILLICIDDLNTQLACYGHKHVHSPNIDKLATQGRQFSRHYVQAPTCGASRFSLLIGNYPPLNGNNGLVAKHYAKENPSPSLPHWFKSKGYQTISIGKISHHPGGYMGKEWNDPEKPEMPGSWTRSLMPCGIWKTPRGAMHGYAEGKPRTRAYSPRIETTNKITAYPDDLILMSAVNQLNNLNKQDKPWLLAVGFIKPHLPFTAPQKFLDHYKDVKFPPIPSPDKPEGPSLWHGSGEFMRNYADKNNPNKDLKYALNVRKHYAASTSYVDDNVGKLLKHLEKSGSAKNTIIVLWGDHGFSLGEKQIWGKHHLYHTALHSPLIIKTPDQKTAGKATTAVTETIDIYPTLCTLAGIPLPDHLDGKSLAHIVNDPSQKSDGIANSFWAGKKSIITKDTHTIFKKGKVFLKFDLTKDPQEIYNLVN